jgi:cellobiose phosphorylase
MLALAVMPEQSLDNLTRLRSLGAEGKYGFYESLDFNQPDAGRLASFSIVRSFMTHHQGMSLVAINNFLNRNIMRYRFHRDPVVQSAETLLEEKRTSITVTLASRGYTINIDASAISDEKPESRICVKTNLVQPLVHILSNARYMVMLTSDGAGLSRYDDLLITRWQPDTIHNQSGTFIYVRHLATQQKWSTGYLPTQTEPDDYQVQFSHDRAEYTRRDGSIQTHTNITVSPIRNCEIRRITLTNHESQAADIELTSYLEVVADDYMADTSHPSFSKLFIETEYIADRSLLIACRRKRSPEDQPRFVMHAVLPEVKLLRPVEFEIDRLHFIGRGGSLAEPAVIDNDIAMHNQAGFSRDTILSLRAVVSVPAGRSVSLSFVTGFCDSRADVMSLSHELSKPFSAVDTFALALASGKLELKYLNISSRQLNAILNLSSYLFYPDLATRGSAEIISRLKLGQSGLWRYSISGDLPIILLRVSELKELPIIQDVLLAYEYLRVKQVRLDLVILIEEAAGYLQTLEQQIREMTGNLKIFNQNQQKPSLFLLQKTYLQEEEFDLLIAVSRLVLNGRTGLYGLTFRQNPQARETAVDANTDAIILPAGDNLTISSQENAPAFDYAALEFYNGIGGFAQDGQEYEIHLSYGRKTPMPWINVVANDSMGFLISEIGAGYTWVGNSRENKLTTWSNDPVLDPVSEAIYIRDDEGGGITSPTALIPGYRGNYKVRHGFGYSVFEHHELALDQTMTVFVPADDPVKLWLLTIKNTSGQKRSLTITLSVEWVLGVVRSQSAPYIMTAFHPDSELLTANNLYNDTHRTHPAYVFSSAAISSYSSDRKTFFGIGGSIRYPSGLARENLQNDTGIGLDPCAIIQVRVQLEPGAATELVFGLGQAEQLEMAAAIADKYRQTIAVAGALKRVRDVWADRLGSITITTPDRAMDILANGWLQYQVLSCRIMARAAFYQCGGAIGFRDQLQDVLALLDTDPERVRRQILICCSRQFIEGDVQHWWHQDSGLGVRTRISDDLLWLPYVTAAYAAQTGDYGILDIDVPFITGDQLDEGQAEMMSRPQIAREQASVYQHCLRAIDRASHMGKHGLPLMGGGDWNDGMNRVGIGGRGESVWLGWFLYTVLQRFIPIMQEQGDVISSQQMTTLADDLLSSIERNAWDGEWYLRAFFDDGTPLGSSASIECRIDSISQSWSVLSEGASHIRALTALDSARRHLVREADGISLLLAPPFDKSDYDPGYIKGYYPGIRENGGQYTHGAIWLAMAYAQKGKGYDASELLTMLNPIHATATIMAVNKYEKEPYVMAADISMGGNYTGKAGWSWYTGSAGWMYQAIVHSFLGIVRKKDRLFIQPAVPLTYKRYVVEYRYGASLYEITVLMNQQNNQLTVDGQLVEDESIQLTDDGLIHNVVCQISSGL